jgi:hypothetical protein
MSYKFVKGTLSRFSSCDVGFELGLLDIPTRLESRRWTGMSTCSRTMINIGYSLNCVALWSLAAVARNANYRGRCYCYIIHSRWLKNTTRKWRAWPPSLCQVTFLLLPQLSNERMQGTSTSICSTGRSIPQVHALCIWMVPFKQNRYGFEGMPITFPRIHRWQIWCKRLQAATSK